MLELQAVLGRRRHGNELLLLLLLLRLNCSIRSGRIVRCAATAAAAAKVRLTAVQQERLSRPGADLSVALGTGAGEQHGSGACVRH